VKLIKHLLVLVILILYFSQVFSQNLNEKLPLQTVLIAVEQKYEITFTYVDKNIEGIVLMMPGDNLNLDEILEYLHEHSGLFFQPLSARNIAIRKDLPFKRNFCGFIIDRESGEYLHGATIQSDSIGALSDANGYFELKDITMDDTLHFRFLGYATLDVPVHDLAESSCDTIYLKQKVRKLHEVIVANFITKGINMNSDGSFNIETQTLGILPGLTDPDVLQTVQALPGIQSINETVSDINVRGGTNDQNLIFWDGVKMYQSGHFFGLISAFNPYLTKEVHLIKNGTTTALSDGVSSTIDIRTDDHVSQTFSGGAGINMINADLFLKFPVGKKISFQVSTRRSISDILQTPTYEQYFNRIFRNTDVIDSTDPVLDTLVDSDENFKFHDLTVKFLYDISKKDKIRLNFLRLYNTVDYKESALISNNLESKTSGLEQESLTSGLSYSRLWNEKLVTTAQLYYSAYELGAINFDVLNDQRLIQENKVLDTGLKLDARIGISNTFDLLTGYQFSEVGITNLEDVNNPVYRKLIKEVLQTHAMFAEGNYTSKSNNTNLRVGVRANYFQKFDRFIFEPRLAFSQRFLRHFYFEVLGEMKSQTTTQVIDLQNDFLGVEKRRWILANDDDIPIVQSKQVSVGMHYQQNNFLISIDGYYKQVDDITSSSQGFQNQFQYIRSVGSYNVKGVDFLINYHFGNFRIWTSYSFADNIYDFPEFQPPVFPNNLDVRHTTSIGSSYQLKNFQLSAGVNWHTGKPYTEPLGIVDGDIVYDTPNNIRIDDYLRLDISAKYQFPISRRVRGTIGASFWNLLNKQNIINTYFAVDQNGDLETIQQYALRFTPNFMFRISF